MIITQPDLTNLPKLQISDRSSAIGEALSIYINQLIYELRERNRDIISLSLGEAYFDLPLFDFNKLDKEKCFHYTHSRGILELRVKIANYYNSLYGASIDPNRNLLITAGSKPAIFMALQAILNPGDEVLIPEPAWLSYQEHVRLLDAKPCSISYDVPVERFSDYISPRSRILILNNPNNPSGRIYTETELRTVAKICRERGVYVLVDEAYSDFTAEEGQFRSMANVVPNLDGIIVVNSLSKNLGMSGFRIGYTIAEPELINVLLKLNQHIITCAPSILLYYVSEYFDDIIRVTMPQIRKLVEKRARIAAMMDRIGLKYITGGGSFYFFVSLEDAKSSGFDIALNLLLSKGVAVVPGSAYGRSTERFLRISIGTETDERIEEGLWHIKNALTEAELDPKAISALLIQENLPFFQTRAELGK